MLWGQYDTKGQDPESLRHNPGVLDMPRGEMFLAACMNVMRHKYGFVQSAEQNRAVDAEHRPLPLYTYPAIEYICQFDYRDKRVFEYGAGSSTLFWMDRVKKIVSIENNPIWYDGLKPHLAASVDLRLEEGDRFPGAINDYEQQFDVIIIDGAGYRYDCAVQALAKLKRGGMVILDNADWHPNTAGVLRGGNLLQVDMTGFKPTEHHASTTSIFFHREFAFPTLEARQPSYGMGAKRIHSSAWDQPYVESP